jgi:hypothetical protein
VRLVLLAALVEAAAGFILVIAPGLFASLIFGSDLAETGILVARLAGIALLTVALACWPANRTLTPPTNVVRALVFYNVVVAIYLADVAIGPKLSGPLLWPVVALHALLALLLIRVLITLPRAKVDAER